MNRLFFRPYKKWFENVWKAVRNGDFPKNQRGLKICLDKGGFLS